MSWCCEPTLQHTITDLRRTMAEQTGIPVRVFTSPDLGAAGTGSRIALAATSSLARERRVECSDGAPSHQAGDATASMAHHSSWAATVDEIANAKSTSPSRAPQSRGLAEMTIALVDPATALAGAEGKRALQALGLWEAVSSDRSASSILPTRPICCRGKVQLALVYATDVAADPAFAVTGQISGL